MAEYGRGERAYYARRNQTRTRAEQNTFSRRKRHVYVGQRTGLATDVMVNVVMKSS